MESFKTNSGKDNREDISLNELFEKTGKVFNNIGSGFRSIFDLILNSLLLLLLFIKRNLVWLIAGACISFGYGLYLRSTIHSYKSALVVKTNFNSSRTFYGTIDYFNSLIINGEKNELSKILGISVAEASSLQYMGAEPVRSEVINAEIYNDLFLKNKYNTRFRMDTFWTRVADYNNFKSSLTKFDYPIHELTVNSTDPSIFTKLQKGIIDKISSNEHLQQLKAADITVNQQTVELIGSSLQSLDTLKEVYNKRLAAGMSGDTKNGNTYLVAGNLEAKYPELEVYNKLLQLKDELKDAKKDALEKEIIQAYSPFALGIKETISNRELIRYSAYGALAAFLIVTLISLYKYLTAQEKKYKQKMRTSTN